MPDIAVADVIEATIGYRFQGQQMLMVRHYVCRNLPVDPDYDTWLGNIAVALQTGGTTGLSDAMKAMQHSDTEITFIRVQGVSPARRFYRHFPVSYFGTNGGGQVLPSNTAVVCTIQPIDPGRGRSGSAHLGGLAAAPLDASGLWRDAFMTLGADLCVALKKGIGGLAPNNYFKACMYAADTGGANDALDAFPQRTARVMRRRTVGLGI